MHRVFLILVAAFVFLTTFPVWAQPQGELVGSITSVKGTIHLVRADKEVAAAKGTRLYASDILRTDKGAAVGVVLRDDSTLSLGPSSELRMADFKFKPDAGILGMTLNVAKGTLVYVSGQIAKLAPGSAKIETPAGVAAIRGTKLLVEVPPAKEDKRKEQGK